MYMWLKQEGPVSTLSDKTLKLIGQLKYLTSNISSTKMISRETMDCYWQIIDQMEIWSFW